MNGPGDIPLTYSSTPDTRPCSIISIIPTLGMASCRGRAEAFARRLSSKLRVLGTQNDDDPTLEDNEPIMNGGLTNTWMPSHESEQTVTDLQPLRNESDSFFDFDCEELESPGSPVDECDYLRLIETASNTPHNNSVAESGCVCVSAASSHSSTDVPYYNVSHDEIDSAPIQSQQQQPIKNKLSVAELPEYVNSLKINGTPYERLSNGHMNEILTEDDDDGDIEVVKEIKYKKQQHYTEENQLKQQKNGISEAMKTLPVTGPDVAPITNVNNNYEINQLSSKDMARVQHQIIDELQKQSDCLTSAKENGHYENVEGNSVANATEKVHEVKHAITNGHTEDDEEVLNIEMTEIETSVVNVNKVEEVEPVKAVEVAEVKEQVIEGTSVVVEKSSPTKKSENENEAGIIKTETIAKATEKPEGIIEVVATAAITATTADPTSIKATTATTAKIAKMPETIAKVPETTTKKPAAQPQPSQDTTDDEDDCRPQRVRRCSSLKTGKTPPGTPGRKKIVRFADVLGLDLADIKTFLDEIPTIPNSAYEDLKIMESEPPIQLGPKTDKFLMPLFQQPGGLTNFLDLVREKQVSLENAAVTDTINMTITGSVRVRNLDYHKSVHIRYTLDHWRSYADLQANYVDNSCDGFSDKYTFIIFGNTLQVGQRLEMAVRFQCKGQQFWDNNYGINYCFQCLPTSTAATTPVQPIIPIEHTPHIVGLLSPNAGEAWCGSFY